MQAARANMEQITAHQVHALGLGIKAVGEELHHTADADVLQVGELLISA